MPIHKEFNRNFFKQWSPDMAYILGFLFADGNMVKTKRGTHFVAMYTADRDLLVSIAESIESNHRIGERRNGPGVVYVLQIGSKELFEDLVLLGLTPNKARRMRLPEIPEKYIGDFVRGYFDGDGNVWTGLLNKKRRKPTSAITTSFTSASDDFLSNLQLTLLRRGLHGGYLYKIKNKNCYRLTYSILNTLKLFTIMYTMPHKLFLHRKKLIFEKFIKMRP